MHEARFYELLDGTTVRCNLCRHNCIIASGKRGVCSVRENRNGVLISLVYGRLVAEHVDPIEKKPLYHVLPGSLSYSIATAGCNFRCRHCQNYSISQVPAKAQTIPGALRTPEAVVNRALEEGCSSISYTYTEPTIFFEFAYDTAVLAKQNGLKNIFVTNGYISAKPLELIAPYLDAANIDLKGGERFYREIVGARLDQVLDSIREYKSRGIWIEITTLVIPGLNDSDEDLGAIAGFIAQELGVEVPWHVSRFYPTYLLTDRIPTPVKTLQHAYTIGRETGLKYVYVGNVIGTGGENTECPNCGEMVIGRSGFRIDANRLKNGDCPACGADIAGIGL